MTTTKTVLITGAYGYLGSAIRARLDQHGWETVAMVRTPRASDRAIRWSLDDAAEELPLTSADALIHCAYDLRVVRAQDIWRVNVDGTQRLLRAAREAGIPRVLVLSSLSAYPGTRQLYGRAKLAIEDATVASGGIAVRPGLVYSEDAGGMAGTLRRVARLPVVPVFGDSARQFPVHEDDLLDALEAILEAESWTPEVFAIAQTESITFRDLLRALVGAEGRQPRFVPVPWRLVYGALRAAERLGLPLPVRADSLLGLVRPVQCIPRSLALPRIYEGIRTLSPRRD